MGIGTALKILFTDAKDLDNPKNKLDKHEIIALIQMLHKLSESLQYHKEFLDIEDNFKFISQVKKHGAAYFLVIIVFIVFKIIDILNKETKVTKV